MNEEQLDNAETPKAGPNKDNIDNNIQIVMYESSLCKAVLLALSSSVQNNPTWNGPCLINNIHLAPTCTDA